MIRGTWYSGELLRYVVLRRIAVRFLKSLKTFLFIKGDGKFFS